MKKRVSTLLLAVAMLLVCLPVSGLTVGDRVVVDSGTTGDCSWETTAVLDQGWRNYILTISGNGAMADYGEEQKPWSGMVEQIHIEKGVTKIGAHAFEGLSELVAVNIPDSVVEIGKSAFAGCSSLASVTLPNQVTNIGRSTFSSCSSLASITIPDSVTTIGLWAFRDCTSLKTVQFGHGLTTIDAAFTGCTSLNAIVIPNSVTLMGSQVFEDCTALTSVTLPNDLTEIWSGMFRGCTSLRSVTLPTNVKKIWFGTFENCKSLKDVYYGGTEKQWQEVIVEQEANECLQNATIHYAQNPTTTKQPTTTTTTTKKPPVPGTTAAGKTTQTVHVPSVGSTTSGANTTATTTTAPEKLVVLVQTDSATVEATPDAFPADTQVKLEALAADALSAPVKTALQELAQKFVAYEITANAHGAAVQPGGTVKGTFAIPAGYDLDRVAVLYVSPDGKTETISSTVDRVNGKIIAELSHFSTYVVAELDGVAASTATVVTTTTTATGTDTDTDGETPDSDTAPGGFPWGIVVVIAAVLITGGIAAWYFLIFRKK